MWRVPCFKGVIQTVSSLSFTLFLPTWDPERNYGQLADGPTRRRQLANV